MRHHKFKESVTMSTYLVAFALTDHDFVETQSQSNVTIRLWGPSAELYDIPFQQTLIKAKESFDFFEDLLGIEYPLKKLDILPVSMNRIMMGMENWGLITVNDEQLFGNERQRNDSYRRCKVVSHEIAHMWFGNLVTPKDWKDLWLSEGITSFFHEVACKDEGRTRLNAAKNKWHRQLGKTMINGQGERPLRATLRRAEEIQDQYRAEQYHNGAAIVNMMRAVVGDAKFESGIKRYLRDFAYKSVDTKDFVKSVDASLMAFVDSWTTQAGYPILRVDKSYKADGSVFISQKPMPSRKPLGDREWEIPFTITSKSKYNSSEEMSDEEVHWSGPKTTGAASTTLKTGVAEDEWIVVDPDVNGFYVVDYDQRNWRLLIGQLETDHEVFPSHLRLRLLQDAFYLTQVGVLDPSISLRLTYYVRNDDDADIWKQAAEILRYFSGKTKGSLIRHRLRAMMRMMVETGLKNPMEGNYRNYVREVACLSLHKSCYTMTPWLKSVASYLDERLENSS